MAQVKLLTYDVYRTGMTLFKELADQTYQDKEHLPNYTIRKVAQSEIPAGYDAAYRLIMDIKDDPNEYVKGATIGIMGASGGGVIFCYIIGSTPFALDWLTDDPSPGAVPLIPDENFLYLIQTPGEFMNMFCKYDPDQSLYVPVVVSGGAGSGAIFSYIVGNTPLADDWLSEEVGGDPLEPEEGPLYLVLTAGMYYSGFYRFDETANKYVLVGNARICELTEAEYLALPYAKQMDGTIYFITDGADSTPTSDDYVPSRATVPANPAYGLTILWKGPVGGDFTVSPAFYTYRGGHWNFESFSISGGGDSIQVDPMPTASADLVGHVVQYVGTTMADYVHNYFYECFNNSGTYVWRNVNVSPGETIQYTSMPAASADLLGKVYQYIGATTSNFKHNYFYECINDGGTYKWNQCSVMDGETIQFVTMPTASSSLVGKVYQYIGATTNDFVHNYFYECENQSGTYSWVNSKVQPGDETQFTVMPTASFDFFGKVVQYVGVSTNDYQHNYFYECVSDGATPPVYSWEETKVQPGSSISDDGTALPNRAVMNLIDHDVQDDSTNNKTDVKPHLLSGSDFTEIFSSGLPTFDYSNTSPEALNFSFDEKVIGTWTDGKPLYQKTIDFGALPNGTVSGSKTVPHYIANIDQMVQIIGTAYVANNKKYGAPLPKVHHNTLSNQVFVDTRNDSVFVATASDQSAYNAYFTLRYTKTTDQPVATGEKIVGQWIDGKALYEKTVNCGAGPNSNGTKEVTHGIVNIDTPVSISGIVLNNNPTGQSLPLEYGSGNSMVAANFGRSIIKIFTGSSSDRRTYTIYATLRYTKT